MTKEKLKDDEQDIKDAAFCIDIYNLIDQGRAGEAVKLLRKRTRPTERVPIDRKKLWVECMKINSNCTHAMLINRIVDMVYDKFSATERVPIDEGELGEMFVKALQGDYSKVDEVAKKVKIFIKDGNPCVDLSQKLSQPKPINQEAIEEFKRKFTENGKGISWSTIVHGTPTYAIEWLKKFSQHKLPSEKELIDVAWYSHSRRKRTEAEEFEYKVAIRAIINLMEGK